MTAQTLPSNAPEQCSVAMRLAMRLVRPRTDGRNGLTKIVVQSKINPCVSNARKIGETGFSLAATGSAYRYAVAT